MGVLRAQSAARRPTAAGVPGHRGSALFGLRRESVVEGAEQTLLAIYNLSADTQRLPLAELNLDAGLRWRELLSGAEIGAERGDLMLPPYAYCWLAADTE